MIYSKKVFTYLLTSEISSLLKKQYFFIFESHLNFLNKKNTSVLDFKKFISKSNFRNFFLVNYFSLNFMKFPLIINFIFYLEIFEKLFLYFYLKKRIFIAFNFKNYIFIKLLFSYTFLFSEFQHLNVLKEFLSKNFYNFSIIQKDFRISC